MSEITNNDMNVDKEEITSNDQLEINDPLVKLIQKHKSDVAKYGEEAESVKVIRKEVPLVDDNNTIISVDSDKIMTNEELPIASTLSTTNSDKVVIADKVVPITSDSAVNTIEDEYGDNDLNEEIAAQEAKEQREREIAIQQKKEEEEAEKRNKTKVPEYKNPQEMGEAIGFQTDKIAMINRMTQMVLKKYFIKEGEIPESYPAEGAGEHLTRLQCLGELTALYEAEGAYITPKFEEIILNNWKMNNGQFAKQWVEENTAVDENGEIILQKKAEDTSVSETSQNAKVPSNEPPTINIFTPDDVSSVTVNIDEEALGEMNFSNKVNVNVIKVSTEDMFAGKKIIENSDKPGIIREFTSSSVDVQCTLPASGYRCL